MSDNTDPKSNNSSTPPSRSRRRIAARYCACILVLGIGMVIYIEGCGPQANAVHAIRQDGGTVWYAFDSHIDLTSGGMHGDLPSVPEPTTWQPSTTGTGPSQWVSQVQVFLAQVGVRDIWDNVQSARLNGCHVSSSLFHDLRHLKKLQWLSLSGAEIDADAARHYFTEYTGLEYLILERTKINDRHLHALSSASSLRWLSISNTNITDAGISHLKRCVQLRVLDATDTQITDASAASIASLPRLAELRLNGTGIKDEGLSRLASMPHLQRLELKDTHITGNGLKELQSLRSLNYLDVSRTRVTDQEIEEFRQARPDVVVIGGEWTTL